MEKCADSDTLYEIKAKFPFSEDTRYYKLFTKPFDESEAYLSSFMGILNTENLNEEMMYPVYRGKNIFNKDDYTPFFKIDETVLIKCANLNYDNYLFWKEFNDIIQLSTIPLFPASKNIYSNINGGLGYGTGYGSAEYLVNIREMVEN